MKYGTKRAIATLAAFSVAVIAVLWLRSILGISPNFAGDGGPNFLPFFQVIALAAVALVSGLIGLFQLCWLVFLILESRARPANSDDADRS